MKDGENFVIVASIGGNPKNPAWYHNLVAHPDTEIDVPGGRRVRARQATREEAAELWPRLTENYPPFKTYVTRTDREFPVMILEPRPRRAVGQRRPGGWSAPAATRATRPSSAPRSSTRPSSSIPARLERGISTPLSTSTTERQS
jgi:deazaflavin-dependent oxidoreductase (nitroreductase family)